MNYQYIFSIVGLLFVTSFFAQENTQHFSVGVESNSQYNMDDAVTGDFEEDNRFRSNNYIKLGYDINDLSFGLQLESYAPQAVLNYSPKFDSKINIGTASIAYNKKKWGVTLGHFYEQFGSGLVLRSWEDRQLGINNAILGGKLTFNPSDKIKMTALYGKQRIGFAVSEGQIFGVDTNFDLSSEDNSLNVGASAVGRYQNIASTNVDFNPITYAFSGRTEYAKGNVFANIEGVLKTKDAIVENQNILTQNLFYGNAVKLELGYSKKGIGVVTTLRRLENMSFFSDREVAGNLYQEQIVNYVPALTKQQEYGLANMYVYTAQPNISFSPKLKSGEIGGQIDFFYSFKKETAIGGKYGTKVNINFANWYGLDADYYSSSSFRRVNVNALNLGEQYLRDINLEIKKKLSKKTKIIFTYINSIYNKNYVEGYGDEIKYNILVADVKYKLSRKKSIRMDVQGLWTKQDKKDWAAATLEFTPNTHFGFFVTDMYNYGNEHEDEKNHFFSLGGSYSKGRSRFALSYGRQRAGLLCVGGVCRYVPASTGLTFGLTTSL